VETLAFFMQQLVKTGCCFHLETKGAVNIEENQKLYKHMERGESHLRYQRLSAPVPPHVQPDGMVRGIAVRGDSFWGAAALFPD
jgi:hypothetical protein